MSYLPLLDSYKEAKEILKRLAELGQIISTRDNLETPHYHHPIKGCLLIKTYGKGDLKHRVIYQTCKTHNVKVCRCGWEFGWHFGTNTKSIIQQEKDAKTHRYCHCGLPIWSKMLCKHHYWESKKHLYNKKVDLNCECAIVGTDK